MGVNASSFMYYFVRSSQRTVWSFIVPVAGFFVCLGLWCNLSRPALVAGTVWMTAGIAFGIWKTKWFREPLSFDVPAE